MPLKALAWNWHGVSPARIQMCKINHAPKSNLLGITEPPLFTANHVTVDKEELGANHFIYHTRSVSSV